MENSDQNDPTRADIAEIKHMLYGLHAALNKENASFDRPLDPFVAMDIDLRQKLERLLWDNAFNIQLALKWQSTLESASYVKKIGVDKHYTNLGLRELALKDLPATGLFIEFGVFRGHWINVMADMRPDAHFFGFDSFEGLPDAWSFYPRRYFDLDGKLPVVRDNVTLIQGWFEDTLVGFLASHPGDIAFIDLDCDLYAPSMHVLDTATPRIRSGTRILLDDYLTQPNWEKEQFRAWHEWVSRHSVKYRYLGYSREHPCTGVVVEIDSIG
jgi:hypothetical protein